MNGEMIAANGDWATFVGPSLAAVAAALGIWAGGTLFMDGLTRWRARFLEEAELELDEMLLMMPPRRLLNYSVMAAVAAALLAFLFFGSIGRGWNWRGGLLFAILGFVAVMSAGRVFLRYLRKRRLERFNDQLEDALMSMSNALKAGFSIMQAIDMVVKQGKQPISIEFRLMTQQTQLGMGLDEALRNMAQRVQSEDFQLVASSIVTARSTGGDLTGVFDRLAVMIRERMRIQRRVRTLTAQGRLQATVLGSLPLLLLLVLYVIEPEMIAGFFTQPLGWLMFLVVIALMVAGFFVIRKIVNIDI